MKKLLIVGLIISLVLVDTVQSSSAAAAAAAAAAGGGGGGAAAAAAAAAASSSRGGSSAAAAAAAAAASNKGGSAAAAAAAAAAAGNGSAAAAAAAAAAGNGSAAAAAAAAAAGGSSSQSSQQSSSNSNSNNNNDQNNNQNDENDNNNDEAGRDGDEGQTSPTDEIAQDQTCLDQDHFTYKGQCVPYACLNDKLSRIHLLPDNAVEGNRGMLDIGLNYVVEVSQDANGSYFSVTINYIDQENNQIVSDPENCVDWRLYQTVNQYDIDNTRLNVDHEGGQPTWPLSTYRYNTDKSAGEISFDIRQPELDTHQCLRFEEAGQVYWQCFFEMAFVVKEVTQVSYYFCIKVCVNLATQAEVPVVTFVPIIQVERCSDVCEAEIDISSTLSFCSDLTCAEHKDQPYFTLFLNRVFYMYHQLDDLGFRQNWTIDDVTIFYQSAGFSFKLNPGDFEITSHLPGANIYKLRVPIVASNVIISAQGTLHQVLRILQENGEEETQDEQTQQEQTDNMATHANASTGEILSNEIKAEVKNQQDDSNNGYIIGMGLTLLTCAY